MEKIAILWPVLALIGIVIAAVVIVLFRRKKSDVEETDWIRQPSAIDGCAPEYQRRMVGVELKVTHIDPVPLPAPEGGWAKVRFVVRKGSDPRKRHFVGFADFMKVTDEQISEKINDDSLVTVVEKRIKPGQRVWRSPDGRYLVAREDNPRQDPRAEDLSLLSL